MDLLLFGKQGAGKGTLGVALAERYKMQTFEMGGQLRKLATEDSDLGRKVKAIMESGGLVDDNVVMEIVANFLEGLSPNINVLFDGIPRKIDQAKLLNVLLVKFQRNFKAVVLEISTETAMKRLTTRRICKDCKSVYPSNYKKDTCEKCNGPLVTRADDNAPAIQARLDNFDKETVPTIEMYKENLIRIDGEPSIDVVNENSFKILDPIMKS